MTCPPCADHINRWLDYYATPQATSIRIMQIGSPRSHRVIEDRRGRADDKARLVREQIAAIRTRCAQQHQEADQ